MTDRIPHQIELSAHLLSRGMVPQAYHCYLNEDENLVSFFLFDFGGNLTGYQQYRPGAPKTRDGKGITPRDLRYFTRVSDGKSAVFGWDKVDPSKKTLYVVEGIFDAVKFHCLGLNCIAVLSNDPKHLKNQLALLPFKKIGVLDNDPASLKLTKYCDEVRVCVKKDPGEMEPLELLHFLELT